MVIPNQIPPDTAAHLMQYVICADREQRQALRMALSWFDAREYDAGFECLEAAGLAHGSNSQSL
jgi:hypothetical protein